MRTAQYILKFKHDVDFDEESYIVADSNRDAFAWVERWPNWGDGIYSNVACIFGEGASGKTYLTRIWQSKSSAVILKKSDILSNSYQTHFAYILEDIEEFSSNQRELFYFLDHVINTKKFLLITSSSALYRKLFSLSDLQSRLNSFFAIEIKKPDEEMIRKIFVKYFSDRQIIVSNRAIGYLVKRIERSYEKIASIVNILDNISLLEQRKISIGLIKSMGI